MAAADLSGLWLAALGQPRARENSMRLTPLQVFYAATAVIGLMLTWYWNIQFMHDHGGFGLVVFITQNYVNAASASISNDLLVAFVSFSVWSFFETRRLRMRHWWVYFTLALLVALAFAFPLFLLMRERRLGVLADDRA